MANTKAFGVTNIKSHIPITLDFEELNYNSWCELFETHCISFEVMGHLDGTSLPKDPNDQAWKNLDSLVKMWIYSTIKPNILQMVMKKGDTSRQVWQKINDMFQDNKDARANELDAELRTIQIGEMSISDYCHRIKVIADLLANIEEPVSQRTLVMSTVNGLSEKYDQVAAIIRLIKPMPTFLEVRTMLMTEESRLNRTCLTPKDTASSPTILYVGNNNRNSGPQPCRNFQRGHCQYGERCRYVHGNNDNRMKNYNNNHQNKKGSENSMQQWNGTRSNKNSGNGHAIVHYVWNGLPPQQTGQQLQAQPPKPISHFISPGSSGSQQQQRVPQQPMFHLSGPSQPVHQAHQVSVLGPSPGQNVQTGSNNDQNCEHTSLPQAFNTMSLQDLGESGWYMDTGATSHITSDAGLPDPTNPSPM